MKWISVDDKLPEMGRVVLFWHTSANCVCMGVKKSNDVDNNCWLDNDTDNYYENIESYSVSHWMPLPDAPQENNVEILNSNQHGKVEH